MSTSIVWKGETDIGSSLRGTFPCVSCPAAVQGKSPADCAGIGRQGLQKAINSIRFKTCRFTRTLTEHERRVRCTKSHDHIFGEGVGGRPNGGILYHFDRDAWAGGIQVEIRVRCRVCQARSDVSKPEANQNSQRSKWGYVPASLTESDLPARPS